MNEASGEQNVNVDQEHCYEDNTVPETDIKSFSQRIFNIDFKQDSFRNLRYIQN